MELALSLAVSQKACYNINIPKFNLCDFAALKYFKMDDTHVVDFKTMYTNRFGTFSCRWQDQP